ncbi:response regulator [uncultured Cyclobacterium sp.]|uniref:response regulator n=1 Tax=uncultured Cyclobacterium sp. TaxID=453820 RepID=UPI0030EE9061|tara:strand:+ start:97859 stop:98869 length:1011 start_codon:yes stop_codon:yes gene_type:complete
MSAEVEALRILIIEDNEGDFVLVSESIDEKFPFATIDWAKSYKSAVETIPNGYDIILLDLSLGDMSGESLIKGIKKKASKIPIVVLTGYSNKEFAVKTIGLGMSDYLIKDELQPEILFKSITYSIERKKVFNKLEESELRYKELFQFNPMPMWVMDQNNNTFLNANDAAVMNYGFSLEEFLQMTITDVQIENINSIGEYSKVESGDFQSEDAAGTFLHKKKNGEIITVETSFNTINYNGKKMKLILAIDVTHKHAHLKTIEKQNGRLKEISWVQSHVVRAPLARLMGLVHLLEVMIGKLTDDQRDVLNHINNSAVELDDVIRDINNKAKKVENIDS